LDTGVGFHAKKCEFKGGISPYPLKY